VNPPRKILLLGGTGFVGRSLCERMVERGPAWRVTVATRRLEHAKAVQFLPTVDPVECDIHDDTQLARVLAGHDAVVNLVAILHGAAKDFEQVHVALARRLASACVATGVQRVLHVSALGASAEAPSLYLRSKAAGEAVLRKAPLLLSVLRPSVIFGREDRFLNMFAALQAVFPVMPLAGAESRFQPVWVEDVAEALLRCLERQDSIGKDYECAGPQIYTLRQLVSLAGALAGCQRPVVALNDTMAKLQAMAMQLLPGTPLMSRDNLLSMRVPSIASGGMPGLQELQIAASSLEAVAPSYLEPGRGLGRLDRWRAMRAGR
jgi:NADH dehydrogenase